ncbi:unnamed protein product [Closterium sp. Naga37s-1]|nr:unnamed protein product [Closterium sp. Naga37s-1]
MQQAVTAYQPRVIEPVQTTDWVRLLLSCLQLPLPTLQCAASPFLPAVLSPLQHCPPYHPLLGNVGCQHCLKSVGGGWAWEGRNEPSAPRSGLLLMAVMGLTAVLQSTHTELHERDSKPTLSLPPSTVQTCAILFTPPSRMVLLSLLRRSLSPPPSPLSSALPSLLHLTPVFSHHPLTDCCSCAMSAG